MDELEEEIATSNPLEINTDDYGEVMNGDGTYRVIANALDDEGKYLVAWTDLSGAHLDILFTRWVPFTGPVQHGIKPGTDLFVSVIGFGSFGFKIDNENTHPSYYAEKLRGVPADMDALTELINGVKFRLEK